ncbi:hypothetical protein EYZ11_001993 [Aspergillus tanneri]|uniref:Uncharacterized protein n=1 Tax=Aspergillus tanneri TaxID=1220188 RepID=A0A4S3JRW8_9EURO|nr:uncharacterized protein ATNIH1004_004180 [Aspergillus tanneri]KAA8648295.1 hypothetical protein ATNIH1004_004180 [Aspergillus tanneri]THC98563.1 hypothetical protein EYZ11_001993 [Aspergillus tanneri]
MNDTFEVPVMLSLDHLNYEDIAKLNPFYEEYRAFWNASPNATDSSLSSNASSRSSSLRSLRSEIDVATPTSELTTSFSMHRMQSNVRAPVAEKLHMNIHSGSQYKPSYNTFNKPAMGQVAIVEYDDCFNKPLPPVYESSECGEPDPLDFEIARNSLKLNTVSHKKLFGENGWLGDTADLKTPSNEKQKPKTFKDLGKKIKKHVDEFAEDMAKVYPIPFVHGHRHMKIVSESTVPISLDPPTQAKMYSELEVMICVTANNFLVKQHKNGRVSEESIRKVTNFWGSKNRPQVVEFQFDQATQRRLILSNIRTLQFNGESSTNPILLHSNLHNWKSIVKEMNVRTFCAPDSAIRKHMHDLHKLLDMLDAPHITFVAFQELQMKTLSMMKKRLEEQYYRETGSCSSLTSVSTLSRADSETRTKHDSSRR